MPDLGLALVAIVLTCLAALVARRRADHRADAACRAALCATQPHTPARFHPATVADLPDAARRFFGFAIAPGTPLLTVATLDMRAKFGMGTRAAPGYRDITASQTLAAPDGFVWKMRTRAGVPSLSGSDTAQWTRFWLAGLIPVARAGGTENHRRAAFGRYIAEAVFWTPAAMLPGPGVTWSATPDPDTARVTVIHAGLHQSVDITVDSRGQPVKVAFDRWTNANPEKIWRLQRFGGYLSRFETVQGFRLPTHVEAGNHFDSPDYFPFLVADISAIHFPAC